VGEASSAGRKNLRQPSNDGRAIGALNGEA
jgi:hypothetical protein